MKKTFLSLIAAAVLSVTAISTATAQDTSAAVVHVPFRFVVGSKLLPAGTYRIGPQTTDWSVLVISSMQGDVVAAFATSEAVPNPDPQNQSARVWFNNYYGQYFLRQVAVPGRDARVVTVTREQAERALTKLNLMPAQQAQPAK